MKRSAAIAGKGAREEVWYGEPPQWFGSTVTAVTDLSSRDLRALDTI